MPLPINTYSHHEPSFANDILQTDSVISESQYNNYFSEVNARIETHHKAHKTFSSKSVATGISSPVRPYLMAYDSTIASIMICIYIIFSFTIKQNRHIIPYFFQSIVENRKRKNAFSETTTVSQAALYTLLLGQTVIIIAILITITLFQRFSIAPTHLYYIIFFSAIGVLIAFLLQRILFTSVASIFFEKSQKTDWMNAYDNLYMLLGIVLFPIVILGISNTISLTTCILSSFIVFVISRLLFIYKTYTIILHYKLRLFYFFLYLCALEIAPLIYIIKGGFSIYCTLN